MDSGSATGPPTKVELSIDKTAEDRLIDRGRLTEEITIEQWKISELVPYARNPRKNDQAVDRMASAIREFGFKIPILVRSNGDVIDGHLRLKAAKSLGLEQVPVIVCDQWSEAQVKAFPHPGESVRDLG